MFRGLIQRVDIDCTTPERGLVILREDFVREGGVTRKRVVSVDLLLRIRGRTKRLFLVDYDRAVMHARPLWWARLTLNLKLGACQPTRFEFARGMFAADQSRGPRTTIGYYRETR